ncbi:MAG: glycerol-3-phosphate responsive antiterminator [Bacillota bacterium]
MLSRVHRALADYPIIATVYSTPEPHSEVIRAAIDSAANIITFVRGSVFDMERDVPAIIQSGKLFFVHMDLVKGVARDEFGIRYIAQKLGAQGIISTHGHVLKLAREEGLLTIQRTILVDSVAFENNIEIIKSYKPDMVEVMPGRIPEYITKLCERLDAPVITAGMVYTREHVMAALKAGALGVTTSARELWNDT